ncbi:hypothetical protein FE236_02200 [Mariprofundus erugo]|uniref:hypothetical protein n=1 Tax=Mariprofundus erugo TaxID=2528639 RepID=UPI0010FD4684|nr:hypothetical protein [Mariprofundus erugo]TLS77933.1 hypothetical protein FE236_02200 [Mariprofundus erugo]
MNPADALRSGAIVAEGKNKKLRQAADAIESLGNGIVGLAEAKAAWEDAALSLRAAYDELNEEHIKLSDQFQRLSARNAEIEQYLKYMVEDGVAIQALGNIHVLKAKSLQRTADEEGWSIEQRREANILLIAEAEYDYRIKNDPSYRLNAAAENLMKIADYADNGDAIREAVGKMYQTGKARFDETREQLIADRVAEITENAIYETDASTVPTKESVPPMRLEMFENDRETFDSANALSFPLIDDDMVIKSNP